MIYVCGVIGFFLGFGAGQVALYYLLRNRSNKEILTDASIRWTYGLLNWAFAGLGAWLAMRLWTFYIAG